MAIFSLIVTFQMCKYLCKTCTHMKTHNHHSNINTTFVVQMKKLRLNELELCFSPPMTHFHIIFLNKF